ncbi:hypothetical protein SK128_022289, partial [Halocaridina rubra]
FGSSVDIALASGLMVVGHLVERIFHRRTFSRTDISSTDVWPNGKITDIHLAERTFDHHSGLNLAYFFLVL